MRVFQPQSNTWACFLQTLALLGSNVLAKDIHHVPYGKEEIGDFDWNSIKPSLQLQYHNCYDGLRCARLEVPLDWANGSNPNTVAVAIGILPAKVKPSDPKYGGTIFIQPGGPGGSGLDLLRDSGRGLQDVVDSEKYFDILAWDPRGVKFTTPSVACFENDVHRQTFNLKKAAAGFMDLSDSSFNTLWAAAEGFTKLCTQSNIGVYQDGSNIRHYVSTALVARDMVAIVDAIDEQAQTNEASQSSQKNVASKSTPLLNYWGYSYGTYLGNTFASMFPDRIGRMILDGVVDAPDYAASGWTTNLQDTHKSLLQMIQDCFDGKSFCPLYDPSMSNVGDLGQKITNFMMHLRDNPIPVTINDSVSLITLSDVRYQIFDYLYNPMQSYPWTGQMLADLMAGNASLLLPELPSLKLSSSSEKNPVPPPIKHPQFSYAHAGEATAAILCGDGDSLKGTTKGAYKAYLSLLLDQEPLAAGYWASIKLPCVFWPKTLKPSERNRFTGPFTSKKSDYSSNSSPIFWIGNTADPVTPVRNAHNMAKAHEGSVVLTQDMPGHCSGRWKPSACTHGHIKRFFATGELPKESTVCAGDRRPWDGKGAVAEQV